MGNMVISASEKLKNIKKVRTHTHIHTMNHYNCIYILIDVDDGRTPIIN